MKTVDVLIIGQGIAGTCLAFHCLEKNLKILIIDNNHEHSATKAAAGIIDPLGSKWFTKPYNRDDYLPEAIQFYKTLETKLNTPLLKKLTSHRIITLDRDLPLYAKRKKHHLTYIQDDTLPHLPILKTTPKKIITYAPAYRLDTEKLLTRSKDYFKKKNLLLSEKFNHNTLSQSSPLTYNTIQTTHVVFCEGQAINTNPFFTQTPFHVVKGQFLHVKSSSLKTSDLIHKQKWLCPIEENTFIYGASYEEQFTTLSPTESIKKSLLTDLKQTYTLTDLTITTQKAGLRTYTKDQLPTILSHSPTIHAINGLGSRGLMSAPSLTNKVVKKLRPQN